MDLVWPVVELAARNRNIGVVAQAGIPPVVMARQRLFEPRDVERFEGARDRERLGERPLLLLC